MLAASALWRCEAPAMVRSSASWVVSNSTGRLTPGGKRGAARPWTSRGSILGAHSPYRRSTRAPLGSGPDCSGLRAAVHVGGGRGEGAGIAAHRGGAALHVAELLEREGAGRGQAGMDLAL